MAARRFLKDSKLKELYTSLVIEKHHTEILNVLQAPDEKAHYPIVTNFQDIMDFYPEVLEDILSRPIQALEVCDKALIYAARKILDNQPGLTLEKSLTMKVYLHARIADLPLCPQIHLNCLPKNESIGNFLAISGTVVRVGERKMLEFQRDFYCTKCKHMFVVNADYEQFHTFHPEPQCPNPNPCNSTMSKATGVLDPAKCKDYQEIKIQEQVHKLSLGTIPRSMWVTLEDDLVDICKPGDDVLINGVVIRRWRPFSKDHRTDIDLIIKANYVRVNNDHRASILVTKELESEFKEFWSEHKHHPLEGRDKIIASFCPQVFGLYIVKLAVCLTLIGGLARKDESGTRVRGEPHLLLVGDPGTAKSQFLKFAAKICPRSVLTTGIGSTAAGLTVTAIRDSGEWQLEAGALVLADGGVCCIDEFNSIREHDRASIHEAMEQQSISVAKAGLVCKLSTRCSVLAATNPKGSYDPNQSLNVNVALASPLLSRFDLILVLLDLKNEDWDKVVSSYILEGRNNELANGASGHLWNVNKLQAYLSHVKQLTPELSQEATEIIRMYYHAQRQADSRSQSRTTVRLLESMIRLSQAHARLMFRTEVTVEDAVVVVTLLESSMQSAALISSENTLHVHFSPNPQYDYYHQAEAVLTKLGLPLIWETEKTRLASIEQYSSSQTIAKHAMTGKKHAELQERTVEQTQRMLDNIRFQKQRALDRGPNKARIQESVAKFCTMDPSKAPDDVNKDADADQIQAMTVAAGLTFNEETTHNSNSKRPLFEFEDSELDELEFEWNPTHLKERKTRVSPTRDKSPTPKSIVTKKLKKKSDQAELRDSDQAKNCSTFNDASEETTSGPAVSDKIKSRLHKFAFSSVSPIPVESNLPNIVSNSELESNLDQSRVDDKASSSLFLFDDSICDLDL